MGREERQAIIKKIEEIHGSKVLTYIISTRPSVQTQIDVVDLREMYDHLLRMGKSTKIDLFIYSLGGAGSVAWALSNLVREFTNDFTVLVPNFAFSCATGIALGANKIIMGKSGTLGPVDPSVWNAFNPVIGGKVVPISVEDIGGYISLLKDKSELGDEKNFTDVFSKLCSIVHPLALGNAYRHYIKAREDTSKLLGLHMDSEKDATLIKGIVDTLVEKLYFHGHHISRFEARSYGLDVVNAEEISSNEENLDQLMWKLFLNYEDESDMRRPYKDEATGERSSRIIPTKMIESNGYTSASVIEQEFLKVGLPQGTFFTQMNMQTGTVPSLAIKAAQGYQIIPYIVKGGDPVIINSEIYEKKEFSFWKKFDSDDELYAIGN